MARGESTDCDVVVPVVALHKGAVSVGPTEYQVGDGAAGEVALEAGAETTVGLLAGVPVVGDAGVGFLDEPGVAGAGVYADGDDLVADFEVDDVVDVVDVC